MTTLEVLLRVLLLVVGLGLAVTGAVFTALYLRDDAKRYKRRSTDR
jgi:ABC-type nickel/cobalt efflux system permease component RcnA